jgi:2'-5' RNA ligase
VQASLVQKYGIHWIKENFNPHITLAYEKQIPNDLHFAPPLFVNICHPCIYPIDDVGRIL